MAETEYTHEQTARASERFTDVMPATYDEKDNMDLLRQKLSERKKPIYAGLAFLCVVVIGASIAVSTGGSTKANVQSAGPANTPAPTTVAPAPMPITSDMDAAGVHGVDFSNSSSSASSATGSGSSHGKDEAGLLESTPTPSPSPTSTTPAPTTAAPTPAPTEKPLLPYREVEFDWRDPKNWEYSNGNPVPADMFADGGIKLTSANSPTPIRTKRGWGGEKILLVEWERSSSSDTNIWMLNKKIEKQFAPGNGWPYYGELDIFEMFTQDAKDKPNYDFSGFGNSGGADSYGQLTLHNGPRKEHGDPCFCPAAIKPNWFKNTAPMTSGCTAQFSNDPKNAIATIWGRDGTGHYLELWQKPTVTEGGKKDNVKTFDIQPGGVKTMKIYNNADLFWGTPASSACAKNGGHDGAGFPFFEDFYITMEEQKKNDPGAWFKVTNMQFFVKN
ncbi:hypothetical protein ATCC90586_003128 [Pythium insidiosum]|nr:hypothetical protein ATCC90586_003128 [Pythium insidiosum]